MEIAGLNPVQAGGKICGRRNFPYGMRAIVVHDQGSINPKPRTMPGIQVEGICAVGRNVQITCKPGKEVGVAQPGGEVEIVDEFAQHRVSNHQAVGEVRQGGERCGNGWRFPRVDRQFPILEEQSLMGAGHAVRGGSQNKLD